MWIKKIIKKLNIKNSHHRKHIFLICEIKGRRLTIE